jgi:hypothetical protein
MNLLQQAKQPWPKQKAKPTEDLYTSEDNEDPHIFHSS